MSDENNPTGDDNQKLIEFAYEDSAESLFIRLVGQALQDELQNHGDEALATRLLLRLTEPSVVPALPEAVQERFRLFQRLLAVAMAYRSDPARYGANDPMH